MARKKKLIVDGYNMIGAWPPLLSLKRSGEIEEARDALLELLANYSAYHGFETWIIFDAMFVPGLQQSYGKYRMHVVFTAEGETADSYIEGMMDAMVGVLTDVIVATSDLLEQRLVFQKGALRQSALELWRDVEKTQLTIREGDDHYEPLVGHRLVPWSYQQMQHLRQMLDEMSTEE